MFPCKYKTMVSHGLLGDATWILVWQCYIYIYTCTLKIPSKIDGCPKLWARTLFDGQFEGPGGAGLRRNQKGSTAATS